MEFKPRFTLDEELKDKGISLNHRRLKIVNERMKDVQTSTGHACSRMCCRGTIAYLIRENS